MKIKTIVAFALILSSLSAYSQDKNLQWINENAVSLAENHSSDTTFSFLDSELKENTILGLGEASHGTHEFYTQKAHIIQYLIKNSNYKLIGFELTQAYLKPINDYIQNGNGDLKGLMKDLMLYNTQEIFELFQWIKEYNQKQTASKKVILFGFDSEDFWYDPLLHETKTWPKQLLRHKKSIS